MGSIYRKATRVHVWLGPEVPGSDSAMAFLSDLSAHIRKDKSISDVRKVPSVFSGVWRQIPAGKWIFHTLSSDIKLTENLKELFCREYWERIWVMQEISLATSISLQCGRTKIVEFEFARAIDLLHRVQVDLPRECARIPNPPFGMANSRIWMNSGLPTPLYRFLIFGQMAFAHDTRDRIFAVLGLVTDPTAPQYKADYSKPAVLVYAEVAKLIMDRRDEDHLSLVLSRPQGLKRPELPLPSWVPDWCTSYPTPLLSDAHYKEVYRTAGKTIPEYTIDQNLRVLTIKGFAVDTIQTLSGGLPNEALPPLNGSIIPAQWCSFCENIMSELSTNIRIPIQDRCIALSRTVIADRKFDDDSPKTGRATESFYSDLSSIKYDEPYGTSEARRSQSCRRTVFRTAFGRQLMVSNTGYIALGPADAREGDIICVLFGVRVPVVLRRVDDHCVIIGDCYVDGIMDGELVEEMESGKYKVESFEIQ